MTLLSFVAVFAGLGLGTSRNFLNASSLVAGVFVGSASWWLLLSSGVSSIRDRISFSWMQAVNRISGCAIFAFGLYALARLFMSQVSKPARERHSAAEPRPKIRGGAARPCDACFDSAQTGVAGTRRPTFDLPVNVTCGVTFSRPHLRFCPVVEPAERDEQLAAVLAAPPPREVPAELRRAAMRQAYPGWKFLFSALFFGLGALLVANDFPWHFWKEWQLDGSAVRASGSVVAVTRTHRSTGGRRGAPGIPVYQYDFVFHANGSSEETQGKCYTTGRRRRRGDPVDVEYLASDPSVARLVGARLDKIGGNGVVSLFLPAIGIGLAVAAVAARRRALRLLTHGSLAEANVTGCEQFVTGRRNRRLAYRITLRRTDDAGAQPWTLKSSQPGVMAFAAGRLKSKQPVFVLYDPGKPGRILLPESLAG